MRVWCGAPPCILLHAFEYTGECGLDVIALGEDQRKYKYTMEPLLERIGSNMTVCVRRILVPDGQAIMEEIQAQQLHFDDVESSRSNRP